MALLFGAIYVHSKSYLIVSILHILNNSYYTIKTFFFTDYFTNSGFQLFELLLGIIIGE